MTQTITPPVQPKMPAKNELPGGVSLQRYWKEAPDGPAVRHDHERPVHDETEMPVGVWWMCLADPACKTGEWVFTRADGQLARPKMRGCPHHVVELLPGRTEATDDNPKEAARGRLQKVIAAKRAAMAKAATDAANARIEALRAAGREEAGHVWKAAREHVPSASVSLAALVTDWSLVYHLGGLETYALGICIAVGGTVLAYWAVYLGEIVWARRMGYTLKELPRAMRARAMSHARWVAAGVLSTGVWLLMAETVGARLDNWRGVLMNLFAALLIGLVNYNPWSRLVKRRKAKARSRRDAAEAAARAEEERLAAVEAERVRRRQAVEDAKRAAEERALAEARRIVNEEDDKVTAGKKFAERWTRMTAEAKEGGINPGFDLTRTSVDSKLTRKLTTKDGGKEIVIGWEFVVRGEPGVLTSRNGIGESPFLTIRPFLSSMLEIDPAKIEVAYEPVRENEKGEQVKLLNHGVITLSEHFPLGQAIRHPGASACFIDDKGVRWGYVGRDLRGQPAYRQNWAPGRPGGGNCVGITGAGKSIVTQITAYNDLLLGILPMIHDAGKRAMDFMDFLGIIPIGFTNEHRDVFRESLWAEMTRRQEWSGKRRKTGLGGMSVPAKSTWNPEEGGPPIRVIWEEFHMHMRDPKFVSYLTSQVRLQRATAIMAETATQGGGLADMGDDTMRTQLNDVCSLLMRVSDHTANLTGYTGQIRPTDLPSLPGMMVMQENRGEPVAFRSAIIAGVDEQDPESLIYRMREPDGTLEGRQILFAPELPPETIAVFKQHGLMDLWELGKTESGRDRLLSESDPVASTALPADALAAAVLGQLPQGTPKPKMRADDVVLAMLKHQLDNGQVSMAQAEMLTSSWWKLIDGEWQKNANAAPAASTVHRACERLLATEEPQVSKDDSEKQARWSLTPAGLEKAEQPLTVLRAGGLLGRKEQNQVQASGIDVAALERQAMLEAETMAAIQAAQHAAVSFERVPR
jgi:hypothetical protein